jgi:hypothetical protein
LEYTFLCHCDVGGWPRQGPTPSPLNIPVPAAGSPAGALIATGKG